MRENYTPGVTYLPTLHTHEIMMLNVVMVLRCQLL